MGVALSVAVEGEEEVPIEERADPKFLADIVSDWTRDGPELFSRIGVVPGAYNTLLLVDASAYSDEGEEVQEAWQDPRQLKVALESLRGAVVRLQADDRATRKFRKEIGRAHSIMVEWLPHYQTVLEDAIKVCDWAAAKGKRVALTLW